MTLSKSNDPTETLVWIFNRWLAIPGNTRIKVSRATGIPSGTIREFLSRHRRCGKTGLSFNHGMKLMNFLTGEENYESAFNSVQDSASGDRDTRGSGSEVERADNSIS